MKTFIRMLCLIAWSVAYGGQETVEPFLPEIFSQFPAVRDLAITPAGDEIYFTLQSAEGDISAIAFIKKKGEVWTEAAIAGFSGQYSDLEPFISADGLRIYYASNRPFVEGATKDFDIWMVSRKTTKDSWSEPFNIGTTVNSSSDEFYPSLAANGNLYFTSHRDTLNGDDIFMSRWDGSKYAEPVRLPEAINSAGPDFNAYVSPDEKYLLFTGYNRKFGMGSGDLYISYSDGNGYWKPAVNLGGLINSKRMDYCPFVHDGWVYFTSRRKDLTTEFDTPKNMEELLNEMNRYENGASRIYRFKLGELPEKP